MSVTDYYTATSLDGFIAAPDNSLDGLFTRKRENDGRVVHPQPHQALSRYDVWRSAAAELSLPRD